MRAAFDAGVAAAQPARALTPQLKTPDRGASGPSGGRTILVAAGKAAVPMAQAYLDCCGDPDAGVVVSPRGTNRALRGTRRLTALEAAHPLPEESSVAAAHAVLAATSGLESRDLVVLLLSGGASALLALPRPPLTLADKRSLTAQLLASGARIDEINCVRKKMSGIKGGRLAQAVQPARTRLLAISDVPGDDPAVIASGPVSADTSSLAEARDVLRRYRIDAGRRVDGFLADPANETPKGADPAFERVSTTVCASSADAVAAAGEYLRRSGYEVLSLGAAIDCPAGELAREHAEAVRRQSRTARRIALISGGETTVEVRNPAGRGGRNAEYLLCLAIELAGAAGVHALAGDTDGIDGTEDNAGAYVGPDTLARATARGIDARALLAANRSFDFFRDLGNLLVTGPTGTNVNDLRIILVDSQ